MDTFSTYRRFWQILSLLMKSKLKDKIIQTPPKNWEKFDTILTEPTDLSKIKTSKIFKRKETYNERSINFIY